MLENFLYSRYDTLGYNSRDLNLVASISNKTIFILFSNILPPNLVFWLKSKGSNGEVEDKTTERIVDILSHCLASLSPVAGKKS